MGLPSKLSLAMQNSECIMQNEGSKKTLINSVKVSLVTFLFKESNMLIENRIKKRNEQIVV